MKAGGEGREEGRKGRRINEENGDGGRCYKPNHIASPKYPSIIFIVPVNLNITIMHV